MPEMTQLQPVLASRPHSQQSRAEQSRAEHLTSSAGIKTPNILDLGADMLGPPLGRFYAVDAPQVLCRHA